LYAALIGPLWVYARRHPDVVSMRDILRLVPDLLRLLRRLAADRSMSRVVRLRVLLLIGYLASPIDLIPDFVPIIGYADDVVIVALVLRSVARRADPAALTRHWPGSPEGLALVMRLAGHNHPPDST